MIRPGSLEMKLECRTQGMDIARMRMAVVLPHVINLNREVLIYFLSNPCIHTVANPCRGERVIEDFVGDKTVQSAKA